MRTFLKWTVLAAAVLIAAIAVALAVFDWNRVRDEVGAVLSERLGREVEIAGDLDVDLSLHPRVTAHDVRVENAPWAEPDMPYMGRFPRISLQLDLPALLTATVRFDRIEIERPEVIVHRNAQGIVNWPLKGNGEDAGPSVRIDRLSVTDGKLHLVDESRSLDIALQLSYRLAERPAAGAPQGDGGARLSAWVRTGAGPSRRRTG